MLHKSKIIITLLLGFLLFSCTEENNTDLQKNEIENVLDSSKNALKYCNGSEDSKNPYNYVGEIHNEIVNAFVINHSNEKLDVDEIVAVVENLANVNQNFLRIKDEEYTPVDSSIILKGANDFENNFHTIINSLDLSSQAKDKLVTVVDYLFDKAYSSREPNLEDVQKNLIKFENDILSNKGFNELEKRTILSAISTARYSTCYWYNYYGAIKVADNSITKKRKWWQWLIVGVADVGGAIAGSAGGPATAVTTGASASTTAYNLTNPRNK
ncbi:hypothetical protein IWQ47_000933 [Aquimarina sp. EL_43]|uniref:hypothetical protein n=1 Tax=unclassified Aquimarina TaxID=2627091 RepID=UPI0018CA8BF7|nr:MULTISPECIES: hypothetical protein [unclassified Aquimarina]MBG6129765.1 hypothetical protein [Aquimarina sp. EL_35]MBG6150830.1 hypothetical protein [Aquimarina sp. EL_32]MBG6167863.1 hypothetical protein [Aquimarina sp. EL_43]